MGSLREVFIRYITVSLPDRETILRHSSPDGALRGEREGGEREKEKKIGEKNKYKMLSFL